jgi:AcrR family transcriptional regulator
MEDVAERARVARASVFRHFEGKAQLLQAIEADAAERAGVATLVAALDSLPPRRALLSAVRDGSRIWAAEATVFREFYGQAPFDPALRALVAEKESLRWRVVRALVGRLHAAGALRPHLRSRVEATNALWLLTGFAAFDALTRGRGLTTRAAVSLLEHLAVSLLLED